MHKELLAQSPLLVLPLISLFLFIAVFIAIVVRAFAMRRTEVDACAALPLQEDRHE